MTLVLSMDEKRKIYEADFVYAIKIDLQKFAGDDQAADEFAWKAIWNERVWQHPRREMQL